MFGLWSKLFKLGWAKEEDLLKALDLGQITQEEYNQITDTK